MINKYFLSKMNIPAYLKNFLYNRYRYTEIEGIPPIIFKGNGKILLDYRIDGASGGVGDRTNNLFDGILDFNKTLDPQGNSVEFNGRYCCYNSIDVSNISSCTISWKSKKNSSLIYALFDNNNQLLLRNFAYVTPFNLITNNAMFLKIGFLNKNESTQRLELYDIYDVMVNEGSIAIDYEPYGYKVPVVISGTYAQLEEDSKTDYEPYHELTTNIYLDEPIEENESISLSDTNVNIPTIKGTNVLSVETTVQPSKVYIKVGGF